MKKLCISTALALSLTLTAVAHADSIKGKVGITARLGFVIPSDNESDFLHNETDVGVVGGGGLIFGIDDHLAGEFEITRSAFGSETGDFGMTDLALGVQYRFQPRSPLVPYIGAGLDILLSDYDPHDRSIRDVDTTVGVHLSGGIDYFFHKRMALNAEGKILIAPDADITNRFGDHVGNFDPSNFSATVGLRYFFN